MKKIVQGARRASCPSYDDLMWFADTGGRERLHGHDPAACPRCTRHLDEYRSLCRSLHQQIQVHADYDEPLRKKGHS